MANDHAHQAGNPAHQGPIRTGTPDLQSQGVESVEMDGSLALGAPGTQLQRRTSNPTAYLLALQRRQGNQSVSRLIQANRQSAAVQRDPPPGAPAAATPAPAAAPPAPGTTPDVKTPEHLGPPEHENKRVGTWGTW